MKVPNFQPTKKGSISLRFGSRHKRFLPVFFFRNGSKGRFCKVFSPEPVTQKTVKFAVYRLSYSPWEPTTFIFRGYSLYIGGSKPSFFMVLGAHGSYIGIIS